MLALRRPSLTCAISNAGPTDLVHYPAGYVGDVIDRYLAPYMDLRSWSPALNTRRIRQPLLLAYAPYDTVVPYDQGLAMHRALPRAQFVSLPPGMTPWIHTGVDAAALAHERRIERAFLARSAGKARPSGGASGRPAR
jgi:pimeloyl-ACP methyl ester carboxylesterase